MTNSNDYHESPEFDEAILEAEPATGDPQRMSDSINESASRFRIKGFVAVSWVVILAVTGYLFTNVLIDQLNPPGENAGISAAEIMNVNVMGQVMVGQAKIAPQNRESAISQLSQLNNGPVEQRYCYAILLNEMESADRALEQMDEIDRIVREHELELTENQLRTRDLLEELFEQYAFGDPDSSFLDAEDRDFLESTYGWVGRLVLYPPNSPEREARSKVMGQAARATWVVLGACLFGAVLLATGFVGIMVFIFLMVSGGITPKLPDQSYHGAVYAETFAIWMVMFVGLQIGVGVLAMVFGPANTMVQFLMPTAFMLSLIVLIWPVMRGISLTDLRTDIGWTIGNPFKEVVAGILAYISLLPTLVLAAVIALLIAGGMSLFQPHHEFGGGPGAGHPIQEEIASGNTLTWAIVFLTACVAAPIVEETMFRGVLYRHLRDGTQGWGKIASIGFACLLNSLIFASIHPQGLVGIPLLTTLAIGFSLVRQWRNSLVGPMVMHAINNGMVTCLLFLILS